MVLKAYRTKNNLLKEQKKSFSKLAKLTEERKIVICRADKDGKIVILNYDDYDATMTGNCNSSKNKNCLYLEATPILKK